MAKKSFGSQDDPILGGAEKAQEAGRPTLHEVDAAIFGGGIIPESGRQVAKPISLDQITPDPTQPRREIPITVRNRAKEQGLPEWEMWHQMAEHQLGAEIDLMNLLQGNGEGPEEEKTGLPLVDGFMRLVSLASSINRDGQLNAITITARGADRYVIETGERRYQAMRMLRDALDETKFGKIKAVIVPKIDVWRQAAENGIRKPLNAIGLARQLALLIMDLTGKTYLPYEDFGEWRDREFYAQVADGNAHRIPKGESEKILQATGLKSQPQIAQYRALLNIPDNLWMTADEEDWGEYRIRESVAALKPRPTDTITTVMVSPSDQPVTQVHPRMSIKPGQGPGTMSDPQNHQLLYGREVVEYITAESPKGGGLDVLIFHLDKEGRRAWTEVVRGVDLTDLPHPDQGKPTGGFSSPSPAAPFVQPKISYDAIGSHAATRLEVGQRRQGTGGKIFEIISIAANNVSLTEINPVTGNRLGRFDLHISAVANMPLVTDTRRADPQMEAAREAIMGPDEDEDNPSSTQPELPEWAVRGTAVQHLESGFICDIQGTGWDPEANVWLVRVKLRSDESVVDAPVGDFEPYIPEPHPGLRAENISNVITQKQFDLDALRVMAVSLNMQNEAAQIMRMKVLTPLALDAFIRQNSADEQIEMMYEAGRAVLTAMFQSLQEVKMQAVELLRQKRGA